MLSLLGLLLTGYRTLHGLVDHSQTSQDPSRYPQTAALAQPAPPPASMGGVQMQMQAPGQPPFQAPPPQQPGQEPGQQPGQLTPQQQQDIQAPLDAAQQQQVSPVQQIITVCSELIGAVVWFLIWQRSCMYQKRTYQTATKEQFTGDMAPTGLCDCLSLPAKTICEAACCEICLITENLEKSKPPALRAEEIGFGSVCFLVCTGCFTGGLYPLYLIVSQRLDLSRRPEGAYSSNSCISECLKVWCCSCCATMQVATFLQLYDETFEKDERTPLEAPRAV